MAHSHTIGTTFDGSIMFIVSFSTSITVMDAVPYRNEPAYRNKPVAVDTEHKVLGGLAFASLAILSLIEAVVRAILAIPAVLIVLCTPKSDLKDRISELLIVGALFSAENSINCLVAFVANFYIEKFKYDDIVPDCINTL